MPSEHHNRLVRKACVYFGADSTSSFMSAVRSILTEADWLNDDDLKDITLRPDAFRVDEARHVVSAYEVEVGHPLTPGQLAKYSRLFLLFDEDDHWELELFVIDGRDDTWRPFDLACYALTWMSAR